MTPKHLVAGRILVGTIIAGQAGVAGSGQLCRSNQVRQLGGRVAQLKVALHRVACKERAEEARAKLERAQGRRTWTDGVYDSAVAPVAKFRDLMMATGCYSRF